MLQLKDVIKDYKVGDDAVHALKGVSLAFRRNEFVSILGASGCGKTTLLNIIGGLDHYTSGDLIIEGTSTRHYKDGDWDTYRNHRIGFVFQTYNLIPHQSVLGNVELALTLSGVSKKERRARAKEALTRVGLGNEVNKKPNQLSGGQMQRVAIARALVNNPEILLADEPTGALDTKTSVQIMDLIKEIAGERLVIMVTHNPELAQQYSTRIVELKDGLVVSDSNPYNAEEEEREVAEHLTRPVITGGKALTAALTGSNYGNKAGSVYIGGRFAKVTSWTNDRIDIIIPEGAEGNLPVKVIAADGGVFNAECYFPKNTSAGETITDNAQPVSGGEGGAEKGRKGKKKKSSMSYFTAFALSGRNLLTKKTRTLVTSIAGSIGIISVCLVLALSNGFNNYIKKTEEDMLSYYPVEVSETAMDLTSLMTSFMGGTSLDLDEIGDKVYINSMLTQLALGATTTNDINQGGFKTNYNMEYDSYLEYVEAMPADYYNAIHYGYGETLTANLFTCVDIGSATTSVIYDYTADNSGSYSFTQAMSLASVKSYYSNTLAKYSSVYGALASFVSYLGDVVSVMPGTSSKDLANGTFMDYVLSQYDVIAGDVALSGADAANQAVLVVGSDNDVTDLTLAQLGLVSEEDFLAMFLEADSDTSSIKTEYEYTDILGKKYTLYYNNALYTENTSYTEDPDDDDGSNGYKYDYISQGTHKAYETDKDGQYVIDASSGTPAIKKNSADYLTQGWKTTDQTNPEASLSATSDEGIELEITAIVRLKDGLSYGCLESGLNLTENLVENYISVNKNSDIVNYIADYTEYYLNAAYPVSAAAASNSYFSDGYSSASAAIRGLGGNDTPNAIQFYAKDFSSKSDMLSYLDGWNTIAAEQQAIWKAAHDTSTLSYTEGQTTYYYDGPTEITYSDTVGTLMGLMETILDAITYVLVAFTAISLIVSTVMIGVITYVSVVERTKEIGVLRSIGARKKDIRHVFNAETFIIGLMAGLIGVIVAYLLQLVVNAILTPLTGIAGLAALPFWEAIVMICISVVLTLISGLIPASKAAKKDPVVCLRTE